MVLMKKKSYFKQICDKHLPSRWKCTDNTHYIHNTHVIRGMAVNDLDASPRD